MSSDDALEVEVTPEMLRAGFDAFWDKYDFLQDDVNFSELREALAAAFIAMLSTHMKSSS